MPPFLEGDFSKASFRSLLRLSGLGFRALGLGFRAFGFRVYRA